MASPGPNGKPWGQKSQNRDEHASMILAETQQLLNIVAPQGTTTDNLGRQTPKKGKPLSAAVSRAFLGSVLEFFQNTLKGKGTEGQGDALQQVLTRLEAIERA